MITQHKAVKQEGDRTTNEKGSKAPTKEPRQDTGDTSKPPRTLPTTNPDSDAGAATGDPGSRPEEPWRTRTETSACG